MKYFLTTAVILCGMAASGQELFVFSEPASNMPAGSLGAIVTLQYVPAQDPDNRNMQRITPVLMAGVSKNLMLHAGVTFADMHTKNFRWESVYLYGKYRFLSRDELHSHFRMAVFGEVAKSRSPFHYDEVSLQGDKSGVQAGLIATQLWNKLAVSATVSHTQVLDKSRGDKRITYVPSRIYQSMNYSLSAGYLLLPLRYTSYKQTNVNLYAEILAQQALDRNAYYVDLAPAVQFIFNSNTKLNLGYRFNVKTDMERMSRNSFLVTVERTFLNAIRRK